MQCITVKQPWATLLANGATRYLVRGWRTSHRGALAIQAGRKMSRSNIEHCCDPLLRAALEKSGYSYAFELPRQVLLGTVQVDDCLPVTETNRDLFDSNDLAVVFGQIQPGTWAWICSKFQPLAAPVPLLGRLGIFWIPDFLNPTG